MSFADGGGAYVLSKDSAGFLGTTDLEVERVSHFDCPPDRLGLELGPNNLTGEPLLPDEDSRPDGAPLNIGVPLEFSPSFNNFARVFETPDVGRSCEGASLLRGRTVDLRVEVVEVLEDGVILDRPTRPAAFSQLSAPCLEEIVSVQLLAIGEKPRLFVGSESIEIQKISSVDRYALAVECSQKLVAVGGTSGAAEVFIEWIEVGEGLRHLGHRKLVRSGGRAFGVVLGFDPLARSTVLASIDVEGSTPEVFEATVNDAKPANLDYATPVGSDLLVRQGGLTTLRQADGVVPLSICGEPELQVLDVTGLPGRWVYIDDSFVVRVSATLLPCLEGRELTRLPSDLGDVRLSSTPVGVLVGSPLASTLQLHGIVRPVLDRAPPQ